VESFCWCEFAEFVVDYLFGDEDWNVFVFVVDRDRVFDYFGKDG